MGLAGCARWSRPSPEKSYQAARANFERGELLPALQIAQEGMTSNEKKRPEWAWRFRVLSAEILAWQGKSKESLELLEQDPPASLTADEVAVRQRIVQSIANYYLQRFDEAEHSLALAERLAVVNQPQMIGDIATAKGTLSTMRGNFTEAEKFQRQALQEGRKQNRLFLQTHALGNLGFLAMRRQHYSEAIDWSEQALASARTLDNRTLMSKSMGNLGWCYFKLGDSEKALELFTQSESLASQLGLIKDQLLWLTNLGSIRYERREYPEAASFYSRALEIARKLDNKSAAAVALSNLAATSIEQRKFDEAERYNRDALELKRAIGDKSSELYSYLNQARIAAGRNDSMTAVSALQRVIHDAGEDISLKWEAQAELANLFATTGDSAKADAQFRTALRTIDAARASVKKETHRISFLSSATRFYNYYIDFLVSHGREREALAAAEHSRARTLAEGLGVKTGPVISGLAPEQVAQRRHSVLLYYWLKPGQSYLWAVTASMTALFRLPSDTEIGALSQEYRKALMGPRDAGNAIGQQLYATLVAPAAKLIAPGSRVVVLGDGPLHGLNFETLLVPGTQPHYWIEDAVITNASSIALLNGGGQKLHGAGKTLLLIGDPRYHDREFPPLPQAAVELKRVEEHFAAEQRMVLAADQAQPRAYATTEPNKYAYIHFVAHANASLTSPLDSSIVLSDDGQGAKLYARDIMQQPLSADLVTISACYGAGTRAFSGEGLVGLSWAFLRAGAHHVIAALWEVNDASTPQLMDDLYRELGKGKEPAVALRNAKLAMLHSNSVYRRPFYWAAFQLYTGS